MLEVHVPTRRPKGKRWSPTIGRFDVLDPDGSVAIAGEWVPNALLDEGEENIINDWLREATALSKFLCLLKGSAPAETDTMAFLAANENFAPPLNGYARQQIANTDWSVPALNSGDMQSTAAQKTFGPASSSSWASLTGVGLVTAATGQASGSGKFLLYVALSGTTTVNIGQQFLYTLSAKVQ
jgi:hypothetical protein